MLVHPECREDILFMADFVGSTAEIIEFAVKSDCNEFIIGTEIGVAEHLAALAPEKKFYPLTNSFECEDMKKVRLIDVHMSLETGEFEMKLSEEKINSAKRSLERMVSV